jgi:serine/threonine protein kinase
MILIDIFNDPTIPNIAWEELELKEKIGVGAASIVRRGLWNSHSGVREVAIKQLVHEISSQMLKEFLVEIKLTSALHHANVVHLHGISCSPEKELYIITELLHHGSIRDVLDAKGSNLTWDIRAKLLIDAAKGMNYLHSRGVIHRDLKPRNLLVSKDWVCKVADFGASTVLAPVEKTMTFTGTPAYMAPEVLSDSRYSEKADVYAFGVILMEVYTGVVPYSELEGTIQNQAQLISKIISEQLRPDTSSLPASLANLVFDCWNEEGSSAIVFGNYYSIPTIRWTYLTNFYSCGEFLSICCISCKESVSSKNLSWCWSIRYF